MFPPDDTPYFLPPLRRFTNFLGATTMSRNRIRTTLTVLAVTLAVVPAAPARVLAQQGDAIVLDSALLAGYRWRNLGPDRGGRSIAVSGVKGRPNEAYFGAVGGGLWKTTDAGERWAVPEVGKIPADPSL